MLYSILPPILVIFSLIFLIVFLMKKAKKVAKLEIETLEEEIFGELEEKRGFFGKIFSQTKKVNGENAKHFSLAILERLTRKSRIIFLKLETKFGAWSSSIREKRKNSVEKSPVAPAAKEDAMMERLRAYEVPKRERRGIFGIGKGKKEEGVVEKNKKEEMGDKTANFSIRDLKSNDTKEKEMFRLPAEEEEKIIKPIISEKIVSPKPRSEIKDRLEELLIERIAVNPKDIEAYERLGEYYLEIRSFVDAKECFKQVLKLDPKNRNAKYRMRRLENLLAK
jgi:tetratricopeptide (TPR) repeat protein